MRRDGHVGAHAFIDDCPARRGQCVVICDAEKRIRESIRRCVVCLDDRAGSNQFRLIGALDGDIERCGVRRAASELGTRQRAQPGKIARVRVHRLRRCGWRRERELEWHRRNLNHVHSGAFRVAGAGCGPCLHPVFLVVKKQLDSSRGPLMHRGPAVGKEGRLDNGPNRILRHGAGNDDGKLPMLSAHHLADPVASPISLRHLHFGPGLVGDAVRLANLVKEAEFGRDRLLLRQERKGGESKQRGNDRETQTGRSRPKERQSRLAHVHLRTFAG